MPTNNNDTLQGTDGADTIDGLGGADLIYGLGGDDSLAGGLGSDTVSGGSGNDTLTYGGATGEGNDVLIGEDGDDTFTVLTATPFQSARYLYIDGGPGADKLTFQSNNFHVLTFVGGGGNDTVDIIDVSFSNSLSQTETLNISTGEGNDRVVFSASSRSSISRIDLGAGADTISIGPIGSRYSVLGFSGPGEDVLQLRELLQRNVSQWDGSNPFNDKTMRLIEKRDGVYIQVDPNNNGGLAGHLLKLEGVKIRDLTAANFDGFAPDGAWGDGVSRTGSVANDTLAGGSGVDTLVGDSGNDYLLGRGGADLIDGGDGDDLIDAGFGDDTIAGGSGVDTLSYERFDTLLVSPADDMFLDANLGVSWAGGYGIDRFSGIEVFRFHSGDDTVLGSSAAETFELGRGQDYLDAGGGADVLLYTATGGRVAPASDASGADTIYMGAGDDMVFAAPVPDYLDGGSGIDTVDMRATEGLGEVRSFIYAAASGYIVRTAGGSTNPGQSANALLNFEDIRFAGGNDTISTWIGTLAIYGGGGNDWMADYASASNSAGAGNNDWMFGEDGDDGLYGLEGDDNLYGGMGRDVLVGGSGADRLSGDLGSDWIALGLNAAGTAGDGAADVVLFASRWDSWDPGRAGMDAVLQFETGLDRLDLSAIDADATLAGDQAFTLGALAAGQAGRLQITAPAGQSWTLVQADVDGDGAADLTVIVYGATGQANLTAGDFVL